MKARVWESALVCIIGAVGFASATDPALYLMGRATGAASSRVYGLSADGTIAAGLSDPPFGNPNQPGFRWTRDGGRVDIAPPPSRTPAFGLSSDGTTMVGSVGTSVSATAYRRVGNGPIESLGLLPGYTRSTGRGVSGDGSVVVGKSERIASIDGQAFRWSSSTGLQPLGFLRPQGSFSEATDVSDDGNIVVGISQSNGSSGLLEPFRWTPDTGMNPLPSLAGTIESQARGISRDGRVIVGSATTSSATFAVRWVDGVVENLGTAPGVNSPNLFRANQDGSVLIGGDGSSIGDNSALVWTASTGFMLLTDYLRANGVPVPTDVAIPYCQAVSADGSSFGGVLVSASLGNQGFVATIPQSIVLLGPLAASMFIFGRRRTF